MKYLVIVLIAILALLSASSVNAQANDCSLCEFVAGYVENALGPKVNSTIEEVEKELLFICSLTGGEKDACDNVVQQYYTEIVEVIAKGGNPKEVCSYAGLCGSSSSSSQSQSSSSESESKVELNNNNLGDLKCTICDFLVQEIQNYISSNATENEIIDKLNDACSKLGGIAATCESLVDAYAPLIISMISNKEEPSQICDKIKLCSSSSSDNQFINIHARPRHNMKRH